MSIYEDTLHSKSVRSCHEVKMYTEYRLRPAAIAKPKQWCTVPLEKLTVPQVINKFDTHYGSRRYNIVFSLMLMITSHQEHFLHIFKDILSLQISESYLNCY
jgi:hypothetical protein